MYENRGSGWWPCKPPATKKKKAHKPYGLRGLDALKPSDMRYLETRRSVGQPMHTSPHTVVPTNTPRKFARW